MLNQYYRFSELQCIRKIHETNTFLKEIRPHALKKLLKQTPRALSEENS